MHRQRIPFIVLSIAIVLVALGFGLSWSSDAARNERERSERVAAALSGDLQSALPSAILGVDAVRIESSRAKTVVDIAATLAAVRTVQVGGEVAGRVIEVGVKEHQSVAEGDVLVRLDPAFTEAAVARARASLLRARSAYDLATQQHGRQRNLSVEGVSSDADFDRAESEAAAGDAGVALREARRAMDEADNFDMPLVVAQAAAAALITEPRSADEVDLSRRGRAALEIYLDRIPADDLAGVRRRADVLELLETLNVE